MALDTVVIKITGDTKDIQKTIDQLEKVGKVDKQNAASFKKTSKDQGKAMDFVKGKALQMGAALLGAFAIKQVVGSAIGILKDFEKELSTLQSITGSTADQMKFFEQAAKDVGKTTKTSATEVVKAFTLIGSAQPELLKNSKALAEVTKQALILSKAAGIDAASAATALTGAMNQFGVSAKDAAKFTDIFATSQQKGSSFIAATSEALKNTGAAAAAAGISFETTNAAIQAMAKGAIVGSEAGTALRGVLIKLSSQSDDKINPSIVGLSETVKELTKRNLSLKDATKLVGIEGATGLLTLIKQNDLFQELDGTLNEVGNAMEQMEVNTANLDGSLDELDNAWENLILAFKDSEGALKGVTDGLTNILESTTSLIEAEGSLFEKLLSVFDATGISATRLRLLSIARKTMKESTEEATEATKGSAAALDADTDATNRNADSKKKALNPFQLLNKRIIELKRELEAQSLAGDISTKTLGEYKKAVRQAEEAVVGLDKALEDTLKELPLMNTELNKLFIFEPPFIEMTTALDDFFEKYGDHIDGAIEAEQSLFRLVSQINTNKLIGIDNEEKAQIKALEEQGLGEEEFAKKKIDIQEQIAEERAKILTKQAKADKIAAIFQATISTAVAVTENLGIPVLAALIAVLGAAEIATIAAQPIPTFHTGKKSELAEGEMYAKILKSESVIPPAQSKKYKGAIDSMIDSKFERYVFDEYMLPMMNGMAKGKGNDPYNDIHIWNNQKAQIKLTKETNHLLKSLKPQTYNPFQKW